MLPLLSLLSLPQLSPLFHPVFCNIPRDSQNPSPIPDLVLCELWTREFFKSTSPVHIIPGFCAVNIIAFRIKAKTPHHGLWGFAKPHSLLPSRFAHRLHLGWPFHTFSSFNTKLFATSGTLHLLFQLSALPHLFVLISCASSRMVFNWHFLRNVFLDHPSATLARLDISLL